MNEQNEVGLGGQWILAIIMIVLVAWLIFRYLVPQGKKEWRAAGIVQGFVIALYAEMYGFPLTVYVLTAYFGVDIPWLHMRGHLWSSLFGLGDFGAMLEMMLGYTIIFGGIILVAAGWRQIYSARKGNELVTTGLYRYVRHPQYTGLYLAVLGQLVHWPTVITLLMAPLIFLIYYRLSLREERQMLEMHGNRYAAYMSATPRFFPNHNAWRSIYKAASAGDSH